MVMQAYNPKLKAWVKYKVCKGNNGGRFAKFTDVKQVEPQEPFKGVKKNDGR